MNCYASGEETIPEHSDDEGDIDVKSSIFTVSLGAPRVMKFRDIQSDSCTEVTCQNRSMYHMTRQSQDFYKHSLMKSDNSSNGTRHSLTFRAIHWNNFNSTALVGDSNFGPIMYGEGKGKLGSATPGRKIWTPTIDDIDPLACTSFRNVVVMTGTNDLMPNGIND